MAQWIIPMEDAGELGAFFFTVPLDGVDYEFNFQFNDREGFWYFDLLNLEGEYIRSGVKVVVNIPLIMRCRDEGRPPGELICIETLTEVTEPGLNDLGVFDLFAYQDQETLLE
jgi:hypothetical protein